MARYFTHYWTRDNCDHYMTVGEEGLPLDHTAGSQFTRRGVEVGDFVYVVTRRQGKLFLIGKLQIGELVFSDKEAENRIGYEPWSAPEHLIAQSCTPMRLYRQVPLDVARSLRFISSKGVRPLKFTSKTDLDPQTLRTVRQLTHSSAALLDELLEPMSDVSHP
jgi:hypothetical protein